jgi:peptidoglycan biosynthesis protein MviN/MurJ (putative lipid II flippase)
LKNGQKRGPTHVEANFPFFFQDFFGESKIGHFFCPIFEKAESSRPKNFPPLHKKFLASQTKKKIFNL